MSATGTVTLNGPAVACCGIVNLFSNNPAAATVPAGATSASFTITTASVVQTTYVEIRAVYASNGDTQFATLTVTP